ncbi:MAG TPA: PGPGW domain-containing protein [Candidatus Saccharimonadales bacterium]|nr:PGPGW domain-containing protein [Candidatus Saccharimonadales bacterium]
MSTLHAKWKKIPRAIRKPLIFMVGFAVVTAGLAMLVLPGPGWAAIFLGFAILATEFAFAEKVRDWLVIQLKYWLAWLQKQGHRFWRRPPKPPRNSS